MSQKYNVKNEYTQYHPITTNEVDGVIVATSIAPFDPTSVLTFSSPVSASVPVVLTITGPKGLYVALPKNAAENSRLIWSKDKFEWIVSVLPGSNPQAYQFYPRNGQDLYWVDIFGTGNNIIVFSGARIVPPQNFWTLTKA